MDAMTPSDSAARLGRAVNLRDLLPAGAHTHWDFARIAAERLAAIHEAEVCSATKDQLLAAWDTDMRQRGYFR